MTALGRVSFWGLALSLFLCCASTSISAQEWLNIRVNADTTLELQNEEQIAINPTDPDNMVAVWRDFRLGFRQVGWGYTFDGGATWTDGGLFVEPNYMRQSDPGVTTDNNGNFYAVVLSSDGVPENGLYVYESTNGGVSWSSPREVISLFPSAFEDKEFIACDRTSSSHSGNLYVAWDRFIITDSVTTQIVLRRSIDQGLNWGTTVPVSEQDGVHYPIPVVGHGGEVFVAWTDFIAPSIKIDMSLDGGVTFGTDLTVADVFTSHVVINGGIAAYSSPHMDAEPDVANTMGAGFSPQQIAESCASFHLYLLAQL